MTCHLMSSFILAVLKTSPSRLARTQSASAGMRDDGVPGREMSGEEIYHLGHSSEQVPESCIA